MNMILNLISIYLDIHLLDVDPKTTQELMRHKSYTTTMDYYVHKKEQDKIDALNSVFSSQV